MEGRLLMFGFNSKTEVRGQGYLGSAPDLRKTGSGRMVCSMNVGVGRDAQTSWFRVTTWEGLAVAVSSQLKKGDAVFFEGNLRVRLAGESDNLKRYTDIVAQRVGKFESADKYVLLEPVAIEKAGKDGGAGGDDLGVEEVATPEHVAEEAGSDEGKVATARKRK